jgi:ribulose-5-phosphate 4-epimerase/fuculose-1-phosphate aldolase
MKEEGVIKFRCIQIIAPPPAYEIVKELNEWRDRLYGLSLIGETAEGIGYGNISMRHGQGFIITGSGTGKMKELDEKNFVTVTAHSISSNQVECRGEMMASSESLTHAVIYDTLQETGAVFHVHHHALWKKLLAQLPATPPDIPYGTPAMADATKKLITTSCTGYQGIFAMAGHEDGVVCYGKDPLEAGSLLLSFLT